MVNNMKKQEKNYEEMRQKRMEENKKRMEELSLSKLSQHLVTSTKPSPVKRKITRPELKLQAPVRRSSRVADKPPVNYNDATYDVALSTDALERPRRSRSYRRRDLLNRVYASDETRAYAIDRAEQLQSSLKDDFPSFVKPMLQSHVTGGFWLGLPVQFCRVHLPQNDEMITLVDEDGSPFETKYLADKTGLSGGWRGFAIDHDLVDGDALVFQLVTPTEFKVYIVRANMSDDEEKDELQGYETEEEDENRANDTDDTHLKRNPKRSCRR